MKIQEYLESTYLKTKEEACLSEHEIKEYLIKFITEAIKCNFKLVMLRSEYIHVAQELISSYNSNLLIGTVVDFPLGDKSTSEKIIELKKILIYNISDIDFVCDYNAFKRGEYEKFDNDIISLSRLCIDVNKTVKWIIETGALSKKEIFNISERISSIINNNFSKNISKFFIKTSTGYYGGYGANTHDIKIIKRASKNIQIKASGGVKNYKDAINMIEFGVTRIGTSNAFHIYKKK